MRLSTVGVLAFLSFGFLPTQLIAQEVPFTLKVDVSLVNVDVAVHDGQGTPVTNLTRDDVLIYEDGQPQELRNFSATAEPYHTLLLFDSSGSTTTQTPMMMDAANRFLNSMRLIDQVAVATFTTTVTKRFDW